MFGQRLKELREEKKMTQEDIGKIINKSQQTVDHYEKGRSSPDIENIKKLSNFFNVSTDYLLGKNNIRNFTEVTPKTSEEIIADAVADDPELAELWANELKRDDLFLVFRQVADLDKDDIKLVVGIIKQIKESRRMAD